MSLPNPPAHSPRRKFPRELKWAMWILGAVIVVCVLGPFSPLVFLAVACVYWAPARRAIARTGWKVSDGGVEERRRRKEEAEAEAWIARMREEFGA